MASARVLLPPLASRHRTRPQARVLDPATLSPVPTPPVEASATMFRTAAFPLYRRPRTYPACHLPAACTIRGFWATENPGVVNIIRKIPSQNRSENILSEISTLYYIANALAAVAVK